MTPSYDRAPTRTAPAEERVAEPALREAPNSAAGDFASPREPGREAAERVLARDPLASFYFDSLVTKPIEGVRDALFGAYVNDAPGYRGMLSVVGEAAELQGVDPLRFRVGIALGTRAYQEGPRPFELDVLLGQLDGSTAGLTATFVRELYGRQAESLSRRLLERAQSVGDPALVEGARGLMGRLGVSESSLPERAIDGAVGLQGGLMGALDDAVSGAPLLEDWVGLNTRSARGLTQAVGGFFKGGADMVGGLLHMAQDPAEAAQGAVELLSHLPGSPLKLLTGDRASGAQGGTPLDRGLEDWAEDAVYWEQVLGALWEPYAEAMEEGRASEAIGRGVFDLGSIVFGAGELKAGAAKGARSVEAVDELALGAAKREEALRLARLPGATVGSMEELRPLLSERAREALEQQERLLAPALRRQQELAFRSADGSYNVEKANRLYESKWADEATFQKRLANAEASALSSVDKALKKISDICKETDGTNRPGATLGDGTTETALLEEVKTGQPYKCGSGHADKVGDSIDSLQRAVNDLNGLRLQIQSSSKQAEIQSTIIRANRRLQDLKPAMDIWNRRALVEPTIWTPDGMSRIRPGWPSSSANN